MARDGEVDPPRVGARAAWPPLVLAAAATAALGFADGGYFASSWGWLLLAAALAAGGAALLVEPPAVGRRELLVAGALAALAAWAALSALWAPSAGTSVLEAERGLLYAAGALAFALVVRRETAWALPAGVVLGAMPVVLYALATRLFPGHVGGAYDPSSGYQLAEPVGYWNTLGLLCAVALVLALARAARGSVLDAAALVPLAAALYFTFSRGALVALAAGLVVLLGASRERLGLSARAAALGLVPVLAVAAASRYDALTKTGATLQTAQAEGRRLALELGVLAVLSAAVPLAVLAAGRRLPVERLRRPYAAALGLAAAAVLAGGLVAVGNPAAAAADAWDAFTAEPEATDGDVGRRLLSFSGTGRADYWRVAWERVESDPLLGSGAGSWERWWLQERPTAFHARDAHNLYLETLSELGPLGLVLLATALGAPLLAARALPAAAGAYAAFLVHAAVDWDWEMPVAVVPALACGVALCAAARAPSNTVLLGGWRRVGLLAALVGVVAVALVAHVGNRAARASAEATSAGDVERGIAYAQRARTWLPWSAEPLQLLGEAQLGAGADAAARASFRDALRREPDSWSLWYDLALVATGAERERAIARARALNPLSPEVAELMES